MKLTILGSGTVYLTKKRYPSSFLLKHKNKKILLDCGFGAIARQAELNIDYREIKAILITHFHTDHFGDCFNLIHSRWVGDSYDKKKKQKIIIAGPETIEDRFKKWRTIFWPEPKEHYPIKFYEDEFKFKVGELEIESFPIFHVPWFKSVGYKIKANNKTIIYFGDVGSAHDFNMLVKKAMNSDLLIIEAGYPEPKPNHFTLKQISELKDRAKIKRVIITHIKHYDNKRVNKFIKGKRGYIIAEDKKIINI